MSEDGSCISFPSACLLLVCGVPGSGKTLLTKLLVDVGGKAHGSWLWLAVHFDDFYPLDTRTAHRTSEAQATFDLKHARSEVRKSLEALLSKNISIATEDGSHGGVEEPVESFVRYLNRRERVFDDNGRYVGGRIAGGEVKLVFVLDDNMPLRSMRHEYFLLARRYGLGFSEVVLTCPVAVSLARNSRRSIPIPDATIIAMETNFEIPKPSLHHWEKRYMVVDNGTTDSHAHLHQQCEQIVEMVKDALENPVPPLPKADVDLQASCQAANLKSCVHQADNLLRQSVSSALQAVPPGGDKSVVARRANATRKKLLEDVRSGLVECAGSGETWEVGEDLDHMRQVVADAFNHSMTTL